MECLSKIQITLIHMAFNQTMVGEISKIHVYCKKVLLNSTCTMNAKMFLSQNILCHTESRFDLVYQCSTCIFYLVYQCSTCRFYLVYQCSTCIFYLVYQCSTCIFDLVYQCSNYTGSSYRPLFSKHLNVTMVNYLFDPVFSKHLNVTMVNYLFEKVFFKSV